jgi:hypothetical protein
MKDDPDKRKIPGTGAGGCRECAATAGRGVPPTVSASVERQAPGLGEARRCRTPGAAACSGAGVDGHLRDRASRLAGSSFAVHDR